MMVRRILGLGLAGLELTEEERGILTNTPPYGIILFGRNIGTPDQLRALIAEIKQLSSEPPLVMIDQEGGRVDRLRKLIPGYPGAAQFERVHDPVTLAREFGEAIGHALRFFDIEVDFAPVVDIGREPEAKGLERRCFGKDAKTVIERAGAFIEGLHATGVAASLKHFPGLGWGSGDPHYGASVVDQPLDVILSEDLLPFSALGNVARAVMISHSSYPQIDESELPATLSGRMAGDMLRRIAQFEGVAFTDDMEMHAVADLGHYEDTAERAIIAGNDVLLFCSHVERMPALIAELEQRAAASPALRNRITEASARAYEYRKHCLDLRAHAPAPFESFERLRDEVGKFLVRFQASRFDDDEEVEEERRQHPRTPGTGKTGREEWT